MLQGSAAHLPAGVGARLWVWTPLKSLQSSGLLGRLSPRLHPLTPHLGACSPGPDTLPAVLPCQVGSALRLAAGSTRLLRVWDQPNKTWRKGLELQSLNLPVSSSCTCLEHQRRGQNHLHIWGPKEQSLSYGCWLPEVDLCSSQTQPFCALVSHWVVTRSKWSNIYQMFSTCLAGGMPIQVFLKEVSQGLIKSIWYHIYLMVPN